MGLGSWDDGNKMWDEFGSVLGGNLGIGKRAQRGL